MDWRMKPAPRTYEDFQPSFEWSQDEGSETLVVSAPGFEKDQLRVQMDNLGNLRVSGERPLASDRWSRFRKEFRIPLNTRTKDIRAKFDNGDLRIILPKLQVGKPQQQSQPTKPQEQEFSKQSTMDRLPSSAAKSDDKKKEEKVKEKEKEKEKEEKEEKVKEKEKEKEKKEKEEKEEKVKEKEKEKEEKEKDQIQSKHPTSDGGDKSEALPPSSRKRKTAAQDEAASGMKLMFKKPRKLVVNLGVAALILLGLTFYASYKLRKSIESDGN